MSDYSIIVDYAPKDALNTGDPDKLILGTELAAEFDAIAAAIATKFDVEDLATQAQAEAGNSADTLLTPAGVTDWAQYNAGAVYDLHELTDPGADSLLYWNDTANALQWLALGAGLDFSGGSLVVALSELDVSDLGGVGPSQLIDHANLDVIAGEGLAGGGPLTSDVTLDLDIPGLDELVALDEDNDEIVVYDASEAGHFRTPVSSFRGKPLGDGKWYLGGNQSLAAATEATLVFGAEAYGVLERGSYDVVTGVYTAGANGARLLVAATVAVDNVPAGGTAELIIEAPGTTEAAKMTHRNDADSTAFTTRLHVSTAISLTAGETCQVRAVSSAARNALAGVQNSYLSIVELG